MDQLSHATHMLKNLNGYQKHEALHNEHVGLMYRSINDQ